MKLEDVETLRRIAAFEDAHKTEAWPIGWTWRDVRIQPAMLSRLFLDGYLQNVFRSNSYNGYRLSETGKSVVSVATVLHGPALTPETSECVPGDLFATIVGHEDIKELLLASMSALKPVHVLLAGPPALGKSLFLWELERAYGEQALWVVGSAATQAGLWDLVARRKPRVLLVDELDKLRGPDQAALLSVMEGGRLVRAKAGGRALDIAVECTVIAACNRVEMLSPELRSRFAIRTLPPYERSTFLRVVQQVLMLHEGVSSEEARDIAELLDGKTQDVRDAIRVARLASQVGVERAAVLLGLMER